MNKKADLLDRVGQHEQALMVYDELLARFGDTAEPELRQSVSIALQGKIFVLQALGRYEQSFGGRR